MNTFVDLGYILLAFGFVFLNGFFVAAEFAMVKLRSTQVHTLEETHGWRGRILARVHQHLDAYLSACQLGITLASLGLGWIGEPAFSEILHPVFKLLSVTSEHTIQVISLAVAFAIISFLHIVVGELMPKSMAIRRAEALSLWTSIPLYIFYWVMYPAIYLLNLSANTLLKWFSLDAINHAEGSYTAEEIKLILKGSHVHGGLSSTEAKMLERTLDFTDLSVADVMRPVSELEALDIDDSLEENLSIIIKYRYSRYPVFQGEFDQMIGVLHTKDLFAASRHEPGKLQLQNLLRPVIKVSPDSLAIDVFQRFRQGAPHFALVYKRGRVVGFITLDNLLQALIGRIKDEFHLTNQDWKKDEDGSYVVKGYTTLYALEQLLDMDLSHYSASTVSGLLLEALEHFPQEGEEVKFNEFTLIVEKTHGPRIEQVRVIPVVEENKEKNNGHF